MQRWTFAVVVPLAGIFALIAIRTASSQAQPARPDYLSPELRAKVEKLKRDASQPTDTTNLAERGQILWDWINAYSLTGGPVPVMATKQLSSVFAIAAGVGDSSTLLQLRGLARIIDALIREFRLKDEQPRALPTLAFTNVGPFPANSHQTIEQTLTIGELQFGTGAVFLCARQLFCDSGPLQNRIGSPNTTTTSSTCALSMVSNRPSTTSTTTVRRIPTASSPVAKPRRSSS